MIEVGSTKFDVSGQSDYAALVMGFITEDTMLTVVSRDSNGQLYQPTSMSLKIWDGGTGGLITEVTPTYNDILKRWEGEVAVDRIGTLLGRWKSSDNDVGIQMLIGVDVRLEAILIQLRAQLDKSMKDRDKTWGYADADLFLYLTQAMGYFNMIPPVTYVNLGSIPYGLNNIILDLATMFGLQAQMGFAIDNDVSYTDQGVSLNIDHFTKLSSMFDKVSGRIDKIIRGFKLTLKPVGKMVMTYNPERNRSFLFSQMLSQGFPYFAIFGIDSSFFFRGG